MQAPQSPVSLSSKCKPHPIADDLDISFYELDAEYAVSSKFNLVGGINGTTVAIGSDEITLNTYSVGVEYMAMAIPIVASPVGANSSIVIDGENGYLADSPDAWRSKLSRLASDIDLRQKMGQAGLSHVCENFSAKAAADRIYEHLNLLVTK